jgi:branched-chain amino acid transport system permease protein
VEVSASTPRVWQRGGILFLVALVAALAFAGSAPAAHADEVGGQYPFQFSGNVRNDDAALGGVKISVSGNGYSADVKTDDKGRWQIGVPTKGSYSIALDESTLPTGIIVVEGSNPIQAEFGKTSDKSVNFFLGAGELKTTSFLEQLIQRVVTGLSFGLLLALAAIGLSLIFGTTGLNNFAHAEMVTFGALATLTLAVDLAWPLWAAIAVAIMLSGGFGFALDAGIWAPLRRKGVGLIPAMIVSIGLSLALRYLYQYLYGGSTRQILGSASADIKFGLISISPFNIVSMTISVLAVLAVAFFLLRTRLGKATRAVSDNPSLAAASGIDVDRVIRIVWVMGGALAGLAGILFAFYRPGVSWDMGFQILLLIFAAVTLGGLGTAFGALVGSIVVGLLIEISTLWIPSDMRYVGALVILILVLLVRPQGILGRKERIG